MAIKTLRVFAEYTSTGFVPMPTLGNIDYGYTLASTFPSATPSSFQTDDPDIDVTVTAMTDFYVWIRINGNAWNPSYTRNVRVYPDSPDINSVVMNMIIATGPAGTSSYSQIVQTSNRLYFNGATADSVYNSKFAGKTYINELNFGTAPGLATVATTGAYADLTGKPALSTVATSGSYADLSNKPSGTAPISYNSGTNSFEISVASASTNGYLTSTDWSTFNAKYLLPSGGTTAQYLRGDGTLATFPTTLDSTRLIFTGKNVTGATLAKGTVVYINGVSGNTALIAKAIASGDSTSAQTLGVVEFDIANNQSGIVVLVGAVNNLDTSSYTEGVQLYLSGTTAGAYTSTKILAPTHLVYVGIVTRAHPTQGTIEVKIQNGYELDEIHDVQISSPADKDILYRDSATSLWKHASIASVLGYTPYNATNPNNYIALTALSASAPLSYNNTTGAFTISQANTTTNGFLSSTDWNTFNSKQSALTLGNVSEVSSNVLMFPDGGTGKTIGNLTIQVVQASASTNGFLSSTNWTTFNNKQNAITLNTTGTSGASTFASNTLNIPQYQGAVTLTTTGTSGAATFSANTLNIPQYQSVITNPVTGTGTNGYIAYWNGNTSITGEAALFYDATNDRLGIATTTPNHPLTVKSDTSANGINIIAESTGYSQLSFSNAINTVIGNAITQVPNSTSYDMYLSTYNGTSRTTKMVIAGSGNVGIGTSSPTSVLHVNGGALPMTIASTSTTELYCEYRYNTTSVIGYIGNGTGIASGASGDFGMRASNNLIFTSGGGTERMRISSVGSLLMAKDAAIGINTTDGTDDGYLAICGAGADGQSRGGHIYLSGNERSADAGTAILSAGNVSGGFIGFRTGAGIERMRIANGGFVGIGTTSPGYRLDVVTSTGDWAARINNTYSDGNGLLIQTNTTSSSSLALNNGTSYLMLVRNNGNTILGGTSDGGYRLYVNGTIYATSNITANSDLVLKKNLKLVENPIDKINQLNGYLYQWKENDEYQYGVIAQEVEKILPHAVSTSTIGIKGVAYNQLIPVMIEAIKELNAEVKLLKSK